MAFDNSRSIFNPFNDYSAVVMPQGRVQLDADWNEFLAEIARRIQAGTLDIMGRAVYPATTPDGFYISNSGTPFVVNIGQGRIYVDGLLAENHGPISDAQWDPALAELSGAPQPAPASVSGTPSIPFTSQPMFPAAAAQTNPTIPQDIPNAAGTYLFYLDVWIREVTWLQDPFTANPALGPGIIDPAVGVDTSGRLQTVWQVRWMPAAMAGGAGPAVTCGTPDANIAYPASSNAQLTNGIVPNTQTGDCCLTTGTGYTGLENQFYRVQIHQGGPAGTATFKWSRENASVATSVSSIASGAPPTGGAATTVLTVASLGRDQVLNFSNGDWIELLDDNMELNGQPDPNYPADGSNIYGSPGILCQINTVDPTTNSIYLTAPLANPPIPSAGLHTRIIRWETSPTVPAAATPVATATAATPLQLENGLTVAFSASPSTGNFLSGDTWTFSARTDGSYDQLTNAPPRGTHHHYTKLSVVTFDAAGAATRYPDCRTKWASSDDGDCGCCTVTVGDNQTSFGQFTSITQAIASLPASGGTVCILPGQYYEFVVLNGLTQVTLEGSGAQTTLYSPPAPGGTADQSGSTTQAATQSGINAIITIANCEHIALTGFTIEAPSNMACILLDQLVTQAQSKTLPQFDPNAAGWFGSSSFFNLPPFTPSDSDIKITQLVLAAANRPAIAAVAATLLNIAENRILMQDIAGLYPALYVSGAAITIEGNWIGLQDNPYGPNLATDQLGSDLAANFAASTTPPIGNGGIQIGGYASTVTVVNNDIAGGAFNGITLGAILRMDGATPFSGLNGLFLDSPVTSTGTTLVLPAADANGNPLAADGPLQNIRIERNRILNTGISAIGPVGFFNSPSTATVSVANLSIIGNTISGALQASITPFATASNLGYGAICMTDVQNLVVNDNSITDFGNQPGAQLCGIFLGNGEQVEISRNRIEETRDWAIIGAAPANILGVQAGIGIALVTPPVFYNPGGTTNAPLNQPGLPALRMDQNIVRVPLGCALDVFGRGPFAITGNHFASGGAIPAPAPAATTAALTVSLVNLGAAIEVDTPTTYASLWGTAGSPTTPSVQVLDNALSNGTSGMVLFSNNVCQLETRASGALGLMSVAILSKDHLNFNNNHIWMDGVGTAPLPGTNFSITALMDAFLVAGSLNVAGNRFQEVPNSVLFSGITAGLLNVTTGNISTFCLFSEPNTAPYGANANNISLEAAATSSGKSGNLCTTISKDLLGGFGLPPKSKPAPRPETPVQYPYNLRDTAVASDPLDKINGAVDQVDSNATGRVQQLADIHQARLVQATRIAATITAQSGVSSTKAIAAQASVTGLTASVTRIAMLKQQVSVQPPAVTADGWALYGIVNNSSNAPVAGYSLYFVDSGNTYQNAFGIAYSAADGSFQLIYAGPAAGQATATAQLFLQVANASGDPVYTSPAAFTPTKGVATYQVITLPAGEKPLGVLPTVFRGITLPRLKTEDLDDKPANEAGGS